MAVVYTEHGAAKDVFKLTSVEPLDINKMKSSEVHVRMLAAPINPADINMAEGVYGIKPPLPAIAGNEGVGVVEACGESVQSLKVGDWVVPADAAQGTWRSELVLPGKCMPPHAVCVCICVYVCNKNYACMSQAHNQCLTSLLAYPPSHRHLHHLRSSCDTPADKLLRVPHDIGLAAAATLTVNPATAYRMLHDFAHLKKGDFVMQNGANSAVGLAVIQMARVLGLRTINIIRHDRPNAADTLRLLTNLGGDINIPDTFVDSAELKDILKDLPPIKLALNCVGGDLVTRMARCLGQGAAIVTYGGMSKRPVSLPTDLLAYRGIKLKGFWVSQWYKDHTAVERQRMMDAIIDMIRQKQLTAFNEMHDLDDFPYALQQHMAPYRLRKVLLNLSPPDRLEEHDQKRQEDYSVFEATVR